MITSRPSSRSSATSSPATPPTATFIIRPRQPTISPTNRSPSRSLPMPSALTGAAKPHPTTAATSPWARTARASDPTPASSPASAASPSTSSRPTARAPFHRTDTAQHSAASHSSSTSSESGSVEQPWSEAELKWLSSLAGCGNSRRTGHDSWVCVSASCGFRPVFGRRPVGDCGNFSAAAESGRGHATAASSLGSRTRLQAAARRVKAQPTRSSPRSRTRRRPPFSLPQPKIVSIRLRMRWLTA